MARGEKKRKALVTPEVRGAFVRLRRPEAFGDGDPKYSFTVVLDPNNREHADFLDKLEDEIEAACEKRWDSVPKRFRHPVRDGDEVDYEGFEGMVFFRAQSEDRPGIVDAEGDPITDLTELYSGAWLRGSVRPYAWQHPKSGKGVSVQLDNVMKVRDDEAFSGRGRAEDDFEGYMEDGDGGGRSRRRRSRDDDGEEEERGSRRSRRRSRDDEDDDRGSRRSRRRSRDDEDERDEDERDDRGSRRRRRSSPAD